jgi:hypothetical protein
VARFFTYALLLISQLDSRLNPTFPHLLTWLLGLAGETLLVVARIAAYEKQLHNKPPNKRHIKWGSWEIVDLSIDVLRTVILLILIGLYLALVVIPKPHGQGDDAEETTGLLSGTGSAAGSDGETDYGSIPANSKHGAPEASANSTAGWGRRTTVGKQSWWEYLRGYAIFFPYLWPSKDRRLQILMIICFILVLLQRGVNVLVPHQLGKVTDILSGEDGERKFARSCTCGKKIG